MKQVGTRFGALKGSQTVQTHRPAAGFDTSRTMFFLCAPATFKSKVRATLARRNRRGPVQRPFVSQNQQKQALAPVSGYLKLACPFCSFRLGDWLAFVSLFSRSPVTGGPLLCGFHGKPKRNTTICWGPLKADKLFPLVRLMFLSLGKAWVRPKTPRTPGSKGDFFQNTLFWDPFAKEANKKTHHKALAKVPSTRRQTYPISVIINTRYQNGLPGTT